MEDGFRAYSLGSEYLLPQFLEQTLFFQLQSHCLLLFFIKVHSCLRKCLAQSSVDSTWLYFQLMSGEVSLRIRRKYHQIESTEDHTKHCFKNEYILDHTAKWLIQEYWSVRCKHAQHKALIITLFTSFDKK